MGEPMREVTILTHEEATARCARGDWSETARDATEVPVMLAHGAMHAISTGHRVHERVERDLTVDPL
jgi:hypothetical protein